MSPTNTHLRMDGKFPRQDDFLDLEALIEIERGSISTSFSEGTSRPFLRKIEQHSAVYKVMGYPPPGLLKIRSTSWLDGVRGAAALGVYIFHAMGCWAPIVPAWHADEAQSNILQLPILRTFFVSGGAAVSLFFALSGYVLTHKSLRWMREGSPHQVYPAVASSVFRRGFRLYLPPILLTFCEMLSTRFGFMPPLNFNFTAEQSLPAQVMDWLKETNRLVNPVHNFPRALHGFVTHPQYDAVIWTIPLEFYGSLVCYTLLSILTRVPSNVVRMGFTAVFSGFCMCMGSWNLFCFSAGFFIADYNLGQEENDNIALAKSPRPGMVWAAVFAMAFYIAGFPTLWVEEAKLKPMPGFETIRSLTPMSLNMEDHARFWWSISGVLLLLSTSQLPRLKRHFETNILQYLGRVSFSLYLVHEFCIVLFGLSLQAALMHLGNLEPHANTFAYWLACGVWFILFTVAVFVVAAQVEKWVDEPSVMFARWLEGKCLIFYRLLH